MPSIAMYVLEEDVELLLATLADEMAFIVSDGDKRWKATSKPPTVLEPNMALWHVPSGPLPLLRSNREESPGEIADPWAGWEEERTGANPRTPYFGPGHPGVFRLGLRLDGRRPEEPCGLSSIEWIGNHYAGLGNAAQPETEKRWRKLRRDIAGVARKLPANFPRPPTPQPIWVFPKAAAAWKVESSSG